MYAMGRSSTVPNVAMPMTHVIPMTTNREIEVFAQYLCEVYTEEGYNWQLVAMLSHLLPRTVGYSGSWDQNTVHRVTHTIQNFLQKKKTQVWYFISKNQLGLLCSHPFKSSPGSHSLLVSNSVGTTSSCSLLAFPLLVSLALSHLHCLCFSVSISTHSSYTKQLSKLPKSTQARLHGNNVRDI